MLSLLFCPVGFFSCLSLIIYNGGFNMKVIVLLILMWVVNLSALQSHRASFSVVGFNTCVWYLLALFVLLYLTIYNGGFNMKVVVLLLLKMCVVFNTC